MISKAIENKGEQKADITKAQKQDLLEYMYGWLIKDITTEELYKPLQAKKALFEDREPFDFPISLPDYPEKVNNLLIRKPEKGQAFINNNKE